MITDMHWHLITQISSRGALGCILLHTCKWLMYCSKKICHRCKGVAEKSNFLRKVPNWAKCPTSLYGSHKRGWLNCLNAKESHIRASLLAPLPQDTLAYPWFKERRQCHPTNHSNITLITHLKSDENLMNLNYKFVADVLWIFSLLHQQLNFKR